MGDSKTFELVGDVIEGEEGGIEVAVSHAEAPYAPVGQSLDALDVAAGDEFSAGAGDAVNLGYGALLIGKYVQAVHRQDYVGGGIGYGQVGDVGAEEADVFEAVLPETVGGLSEHAHRRINCNDRCVREPGIDGGGEYGGADRDIHQDSVELSGQIRKDLVGVLVVVADSPDDCVAYLQGQAGGCDVCVVTGRDGVIGCGNSARRAGAKVDDSIYDGIGQVAVLHADNLVGIVEAESVCRCWAS